jgi:hypothetical protein
MGSVSPLPAGHSTVTASETHWNMSRSPVNSSASPPAADSTSASAPSRSSASSVSWRSTVQPKAPKKVRRVIPLGHQLLGHLHAVGVVGGVQLDAVVRRLGSEAQHHRARLAALDRLQHEVGSAKQGVDRRPVAPVMLRGSA